MLEAGLSPGSVDTYVQTVTKALPMFRFNSAANTITHAVAAYHSHVGGRGHAQNISTEVALKIINDVDAESVPALWMMYVTGLRPSCLSRLWSDDISFIKKFGYAHLKLRVRFTKGIRKTRKRREIDYPLKDVPTPPKILKSLLKKKHCPMEMTAAQLNKILTKACTKLKINRITCGSFRRLFCQRIKPYCLMHKISVTDMMLHTSPDMVSSAYDFDVA